MAFQDQVEDLTSLSVSDTGELSQFLKDGVLDVTNRWLAIKPQDIALFGRESSEQTSNGSLNLNGARIISVIREDGVTSNNWRACRQISPSEQYLVTDEESLSFASKFNPAYMVGDAGKISVFPAPGSKRTPSYVLECQTRTVLDMQMHYADHWHDPIVRRGGKKRKASDPVKWLEFWSGPSFKDGKDVDPGQYVVEAHGIRIIDQPNPYGVLPYVFSYS